MRTKPERFWSDTHGDRIRHLRESPEVRAAAAPFANLRQLSEQVRYDPIFAPSSADHENARKWTVTVEGIVETKLRGKLPK